MLVSWRYRERDTFIQKLDPRARWIFLLAVLFAVIQFWDLRFLLFFFGLSLAYYALCRLTWQETRRIWTFVLVLVVVIIGINTILTGRGGPTEVLRGMGHVLWESRWTVPGVGWGIRLNITVEKLVFAVAQMVRMLTIAILFIPVAYTFNPNHYGVTFRRLGLPDRLAFSVDLAFRFVPTLARDFSITLDAQRARGYEVEKLRGGPIAQIRKLAPLIVPVTINAIVGAEDIINAMDLRCFGLRRRTWIHELRYAPRDYALIAFSVVLLAASILVRVQWGLGGFWVPPLVLRWFGF
ncbi:MAG: energy-coupling factor transporter transmembrane component T [Anaerolineae bacterium]|nr:energy-coupling factor transporter transmembrane protein EcfT [Anaerolineae bacterium]MDW7992215.1 energy-coupling factor transporter transmembrane component T [Anaerolineae bacterium]